MRLRNSTGILLASAVLLFFPTRSEAQTQRDSVSLLVEAALAVLQDLGPGDTIFLDPRPETRKGALDSLVFEEFQKAGLPIYESPGIPTYRVGFLSPGRIWESPRGTEVSATILRFGSRTGFLNTYSYWHYFGVDCREGECSLREKIGSMHGDGHTGAACWEDYFAKSEEERRECRGG